MVAIIVGTFFILAGIAWGFLAWLAAGMADRSTSWWEYAGTPMLGLIGIVIGIALIVNR